MISEAISTAHTSVNPAIFMRNSDIKAQVASRRCGALAGRPDLGNDVILSAIAERLRFEGRDPALAPGVLKAALDGRPVALAMMRRLVLPAPRAALSMPIQAILRDAPAKSAERSPSWFRFVSFGR